MKISSRVKNVLPSATLAVTAKAKAMKADGIDVLALSAGEPDFDTPNNIKDAARAAIDAGETKYTPVPGTASLRKAVAVKTEATYGRPTSPAEVIVGAGGKQVLFNACAALLDPGDEAIVGVPYWVSYPDMIRFAGATPVFLQSKSRLLPIAQDFDKAITPITRLVILNSPSNPSGAVYSREDLTALADVFRKHPQVFIITDDIYEALVYDDAFVSLAHVAPDLHPRMLIASGVSKTYAMTGWRVGFGIAPAELISAMSRLQGASTSGACCIAQAAATEAVAGPQEVVEEMNAVFKARRGRMIDGLRSIEDVVVELPGGAFYALADISSYLGGAVQDTTSFCEHLLESVQLAVVPGVAFGTEKHVRLSFACSDADIDEGVARLQRGLQMLR